MKLDMDQWHRSLAKAMSAALVEFNTGLEERMHTFAVDCHPWNGIIILAFLTEAEHRDAPHLRNPAEMAGWKYYNCIASFMSGRRVSEVASKMRNAYEGAGESRSDVARAFFQGCALAVVSPLVRDTLLAFQWSEGVKITITHPDTGEEYYSNR